MDIHCKTLEELWPTVRVQNSERLLLLLLLLLRPRPSSTHIQPLEPYANSPCSPLDKSQSKYSLQGPENVYHCVVVVVVQEVVVAVVEIEVVQ